MFSMAPVQAGLSLVIIAVQHNLGRQEVLDIGDTCGGISHRLARAKHRVLLGRRVESVV
jgi:hypothetical protein